MSLFVVATCDDRTLRKKVQILRVSPASDLQAKTGRQHPNVAERLPRSLEFKTPSWSRVEAKPVKHKIHALICVKPIFNELLILWWLRLLPWRRPGTWRCLWRRRPSNCAVLCIAFFFVQAGMLNAYACDVPQIIKAIKVVLRA
jgi:hypothetical protein